MKLYKGNISLILLFLLCMFCIFFVFVGYLELKMYLYGFIFQGTVRTCKSASRELGYVSGCHDVCDQDQKTHHYRVQPVLPPVWDRGSSPE